MGYLGTSKNPHHLLIIVILGSKYFHLPGKINNFISNNVIITYSEGIHDELVPNNIPTCSNIIAINPSGDT